MPDTVAGLFRTRAEQQSAVQALERAGIDRGLVKTATPARAHKGHYGTKVLAGVVAGIALGTIVGAVATGLVPGVKPLVPGNLLVTFLFAAVAGAVTGGVGGMLVSMAASGDQALYYEQEIESSSLSA